MGSFQYEFMLLCSGDHPVFQDCSVLSWSSKGLVGVSGELEMT